MRGAVAEQRVEAVRLARHPRTVVRGRGEGVS